MRPKARDGFTPLLPARAGFTLLEILIVVGIISLLSSMVLAATNQARVRARYTKARSEIQQFIRVAITAQGETGRTVGQITSGNCSACACTSGDMRGIAVTHNCYVRWLSGLNAVQTAAKSFSGLERMDRDPWGSPYSLDENEREGGSTDCRKDVIVSNGPNGLFEWGGGDDLGYTIPHSKLCP